MSALYTCLASVCRFVTASGLERSIPIHSRDSQGCWCRRIKRAIRCGNRAAAYQISRYMYVTTFYTYYLGIVDQRCFCLPKVPKAKAQAARSTYMHAPHQSWAHTLKVVIHGLQSLGNAKTPSLIPIEAALKHNKAFFPSGQATTGWGWPSHVLGRYVVSLPFQM